MLSLPLRAANALFFAMKKRSVLAEDDAGTPAGHDGQQNAERAVGKRRLMRRIGDGLFHARLDDTQFQLKPVGDDQGKWVPPSSRSPLSRLQQPSHH